MRDDYSKKTKVSWPKTLVKKWFNIKSKAEEFQADDNSYCNGGVGSCDEDWRSNSTTAAACTIKKSKTEESDIHQKKHLSLSPRTPTSHDCCCYFVWFFYFLSDELERLSKRSSDRVRRSKIDIDAAHHVTDTEVNNYRVFVATWNVAGKSPPSNLSLEDWLHTSPPADVYVLGFQEIVPLNAGNVLGTEDNGPARKWLALIRKTLNALPGGSITGACRTPSPVPDPLVESDADFEASETRQPVSSFFHRRSFQSLSRSMRMYNDGGEMTETQSRLRLDRRFSVCDRATMFGQRNNDYYDRNFGYGGGYSSDDENSNSPVAAHCSPVDPSMGMEERDKGNYGQQSSYCLVASKQMVGIFLTVWVRSSLKDDVKNMKVSCVGRGLMGYLGNKGSISISMSLQQTSFCFICSHLTSGQKEGDELRRNSDVMEILRKTRFPRVHDGDENSPQTILEHDRVIWLGDLNYRIALSYRSVKTLVEMRNWRCKLILQLRMEKRLGRVFEGWHEGRIYFPPTYKYSNNSDRYAGDDRHPKEKRRTPAWCDRILWHGRGLNQLSYVRGESKFSDHRPVYSIFLAEVESINRSRMRKSMSCSSSRVEVEELLPYSHGYSYTQLNYF
ncbi:Type I inositol polyphosphate 5-phosphatase 4 [Linum perenne]